MPTKKSSKPIESWQDLQRRLPVILKALESDENLFLAATANPILAIEEIGYAIADDFREVLELQLRFREQVRHELAEARKQVFAAAGREFDLDDPDALHRTLFSELKIAEPDRKTCGDLLQRAAMKSDDKLTTRPLPAVFGREHVDPLTVLENAHPVIEPLLRYRRLEASEPRFANAALYRRVRAGELKLPVRRLRFRKGPDRSDPDRNGPNRNAPDANRAGRAGGDE